MNKKVVEQINKMDDYFDRRESVPCIETVKTVELVSDMSTRKEQEIISKITDLKIENTTCYEMLQASYRTIRQEKDILLSNLTDENLIIFFTQYKIAHTYHQILDSIISKELPPQLISNLNQRVVDNIGKSAKVFERINRSSR